jgi:hypothetical protein
VITEFVAVEFVREARTRDVCVTYDPEADPLSLCWLMEPDNPWLISRELLDAGLAGAAGDADVQVWPIQAVIPKYRRLAIRLSSREGTADLRMSLREVARLLERTYRVVERGEEHRWLDMDGLIADILEDSWPAL